jgi:hypothetical protein
VRRFSGTEWSEVRIASFLFELWSLDGGICRCLAEWFPGIEGAFVSIACRDGWNRRKLAQDAMPFPWTGRLSCPASELENKTAIFFSPLLPHRFKIPIIWGAPIVVACPWNLPTGILFCPAFIEFLTLALERTREQNARTRLSPCVEKFGEPETEFAPIFFPFSFFWPFCSAATARR